MTTDRHPPSPGAEGGGLVRTLSRGAALSMIGLAVTQLASVGTTVVLARLLSPAELGVFAAGTVLSGIMLLISDGGVSQALIRCPEPDLEVAANTVLWAGIGAGAVTALAALAAAPLVGTFFDSVAAGQIAAVSAGVLMLHAFVRVPDALLQRRLQFRRRLITDPSVSIAFGAVAITACALGWGVWGMVAGLYASELAWLATTWWMARWRPGAARPSWRMWRDMARFASPLLAGALLKRVRQLLEVALVGRLLGAVPLGLYRYGRRVGELPGRAVVDVGAYVLYPVLVRLAAERTRLAAAYLRSVRMLWAASVPVAGLLIAAGTPLVVVLLGERWREAGPVIEAMAGWGPGLAIGAVGVELLKSTGHSRRVLWLSVTTLVVGIGLLVALVGPVGLFGVALSLSAEQLLTGLLSVVLVAGVLETPARGLMAVLGAPALAGTVATIATTVLERGLLHTDRQPIVVAIGFLALDSVVLGVVYLGALRFVAPATTSELTSVVRGMVRRA